MQLKNFNNDWYWENHNSVSKFKIVIWLFFNRVFLKSSIPYPSALKVLILRLFGAKMGKSIVIKPNISVKYPWFLEVGDYTWIGEEVWIDNLDKVFIGANVCLSQGAMVLSGNHDYKSDKFDLIIGPITLQDGVWIGAKSIVCQNVTCKAGAVLLVNSVAVKDLEANMVYRGNPAAKIKNRI